MALNFFQFAWCDDQISKQANKMIFSIGYKNGLTKKFCYKISVNIIIFFLVIIRKNNPVGDL